MNTTNSCGCRGCCIFPNGKIGILALLLAIAGYFLGNAANSCNFVSVDLSELTGFDLPAVQNFGFGFFSRQYVDLNNEAAWGCVAWTQEEADYFFDSTWKAAGGLALTANILGIILLITCICLSCTSMPKIFLQIVASFYVLAGVFQVFTFIAFSSDTCKDYNCTFSSGAGFSIGASLCYWINACVVFAIPMYVVDDDPYTPGGAAAATAVPGTIRPPPGSVSVSQTVLPDGGKKIIRTTVNADGSLTVEETIEQPTIAGEATVIGSATKAY